MEICPPLVQGGLTSELPNNKQLVHYKHWWVILEEIPVIEIAGNKLTILRDVLNVDDSCKNYVAETNNNVVTIIKNVPRQLRGSGQCLHLDRARIVSTNVGICICELPRLYLAMNTR